MGLGRARPTRRLTAASVEKEIAPGVRLRSCGLQRQLASSGFPHFKLSQRFPAFPALSAVPRFSKFSLLIRMLCTLLDAVARSHSRFCVAIEARVVAPGDDSAFDLLVFAAMEGGTTAKMTEPDGPTKNAEPGKVADDAKTAADPEHGGTAAKMTEPDGPTKNAEPGKVADDAKTAADPERKLERVTTEIAQNAETAESSKDDAGPKSAGNPEAEGDEDSESDGGDWPCSDEAVRADALRPRRNWAAEFRTLRALDLQGQRRFPWRHF